MQDNGKNSPNESGRFLHDLWYNYRTEILFILIISAIVALSMYYSHYIPEAVFDNTITPILITATVTTALVGAGLLFCHHDGMRARKLFGCSLLVWGMSDLVYLIGWAVAPKQVMDMGATQLTHYELLLGNFLGWSMLFYPTEMLRPGWLTWKTGIGQLLPLFVLLGLDYFIPLDLSPIIACYPYMLLILLFTHMRAYKIWCEENYSTLDKIDVGWLIRYCCILLLVGVNYVFICYSQSPTRGFTQQWLVVFMMAYCIEQILFRKDPWGNVASSVEQSEEQSVGETIQPDRVKEAISAPSGSQRTEHLLQWMRTEKPYLNPDFQLMDLNEVLPMNRTYLSRFLRDEFGCTFYQFVNKYRIDEAKRLMSEQPELKIADVAAQSGFSSQNVFTNIFTREIGMGPREWSRKNHPA